MKATEKIMRAVPLPGTGLWMRNVDDHDARRRRPLMLCWSSSVLESLIKETIGSRPIKVCFAICINVHVL